MSILDEQATRIAQTVETDNLLGKLIWYSMSEVRVPHKDAVDIMLDEGVTRVPNAPRDADVFKRVASKIKRERIPTGDPNIHMSYRMVQFRDDDYITRRVVRETIDNAGRKLAVEERFDIVFDRTTADLAFKPIDLNLGANDQSIQDEVTDEYYLWKGCLNAYALREWMRDKIMGLGATMVRPGGGVYFVQQIHADQVEALERIGSALEPYCVDDSGRIEAHSLPLVDDRKQREMIQKAFEAETVDAIDEVLEEITKLSRSDRKITSDRYAGLVTKYQELTSKTTDYESLLEQKLASTGARLELFERSLKGLLGKVKADG